jgi:hypothetical protein
MRRASEKEHMKWTAIDSGIPADLSPNLNDGRDHRELQKITRTANGWPRARLRSGPLPTAEWASADGATSEGLAGEKAGDRTAMDKA